MNLRNRFSRELEQENSKTYQVITCLGQRSPPIAPRHEHVLWLQVLGLSIRNLARPTESCQVFSRALFLRLDDSS